MRRLRSPRPAVFAAPSWFCACAPLPRAHRLGEHARSRRGAQKGRGRQRQARARLERREGSRRVGRIGWVERCGQVVWRAVRKVALGMRALISLSRSVPVADPGQRAESSGSRSSRVVCPPARLPALRGPCRSG